MLDGLTTDVFLGMDFLKRYNPTVSWLDIGIGMHYLAQNGCGYKSSANYVGGAVVSSHVNMTTCSNRAWCHD